MMYTIGHSNHSVEEFKSLLGKHGVSTVVDVRSLPGSTRSPQFNEDRLKDWAPRYVRMPLLGGRRRTKHPDPQVNAGWDNPSFKSYADYTLTAEYAQGLEELIDLSRTQTVAIMCGEPMPWRCHRTIISNSLVARGFLVSHIMPNGSTVAHTLGLYGAIPELRSDDTVVYPRERNGTV